MDELFGLLNVDYARTGCEAIKFGEIFCTGLVRSEWFPKSSEPDSDMPAGIGGILRFLEDLHHPICEIELYAVVMAFRIWGNLLRNSNSAVHLDNEAAQAALMSGTSGAAFRLLEERRKEPA